MLPLPMLIGIVLGVAVLVGGGSVAAIMLMQPAPAETTEEDAAAGHGEEGAEGEHVAGEAFFALEEPFIVNLSPSEEFPYSYLKFAVALEVLDETTAHHLDEKTPIIQATINSNMGGVAYGEISTDEGQKKYAEKIMNALNEKLAHPDEKTGEIHNPVTNVFFTTLVAQ
jgi:flagellar basal body-associated protein FliL